VLMSYKTITLQLSVIFSMICTGRSVRNPG
jgi:hypothetical protein